MLVRLFSDSLFNLADKALSFACAFLDSAIGFQVQADRESRRLVLRCSLVASVDSSYLCANRENGQKRPLLRRRELCLCFLTLRFCAVLFLHPHVAFWDNRLISCFPNLALWLVQV
jgi:hypothetical protein